MIPGDAWSQCEAQEVCECCQWYLHIVYQVDDQGCCYEVGRYHDADEAQEHVDRLLAEAQEKAKGENV